MADPVPRRDQRVVRDIRDYQHARDKDRALLDRDTPDDARFEGARYVAPWGRNKRTLRPSRDGFENFCGPAPSIHMYCPLCGAINTLRRNKTTGDIFIGCSEYRRDDDESCKWTRDYDPIVHDLIEHYVYRQLELEELVQRQAAEIADLRASDPDRSVRVDEARSRIMSEIDSRGFGNGRTDRTG